MTLKRNSCWDSSDCVRNNAEREQEKRSPRLIGDGFKKLVIVNKVMKPRLGGDGTLTMGLFDFLLDQSGQTVRWVAPSAVLASLSLTKLTFSPTFFSRTYHLRVSE